MPYQDDDDFDPASSRPVQQLLRALDTRFANGLDAQPLLRVLASEPARMALGKALIAAVTPDKPDAARWLAWASGGPSPLRVEESDVETTGDAGADAADHDQVVKSPLRHPRVRAGQSSGRMTTEACEKSDDLRRQRRKAEATVEMLKRKEEHYNGVARAATAIGMVDAISKLLVVPRSLGPAYTVVRALSGKTTAPDDVTPLDTRTEVTAKKIAWQRRCDKVQTFLAAACGDEEVERAIFLALEEVAALFSYIPYERRNPDTEQLFEQLRREGVCLFGGDAGIGDVAPAHRSGGWPIESDTPDD